MISQTRLKISIFLLGVFLLVAIAVGGLFIFFGKISYLDERSTVDITATENTLLSSDFRVHFTTDEAGSFVGKLRPIADKKNTDTKLLTATGIAMAVHASGSGLSNNDEAKQALVYLQQSLRQDPKDIDTYDGIGYTNELLGDTDEAIRVYKEALGIDENARTYAYLGRAYELKGDEDTAGKMFDKALSMNRNLVSAYYFMGRSLEAFRNVDMAINAFNKALEKSTSNGEKSKIIARIAGIYAFSSDDRDKLKVFDTVSEALRLDPKNSYALSIMGRNYHNRMGMNSERDNWELNAKKAEDYANRVRMLNPNEVDAYEWIGLDLIVFGQYDNAIKIFNSGIESVQKSQGILSVYERDNYLSRLYLYKGMVYVNNPEADGNMDAAVKYLRMAVGLRDGLGETIKTELSKGENGYFSKLRDTTRIREIVTK